MKKLYALIAILALGAQSDIFGMQVEINITGTVAGLGMALRDSVLRDHPAKSIEKILKTGINPNLCNISENYISPIFIAVAKKRADIFKLLLEYGACPTVFALLGNEQISLEATILDGIAQAQKKQSKKDLDSLTEILRYYLTACKFYQDDLTFLKELSLDNKNAEAKDFLKTFAHAAIKTKMAKLKDIYRLSAPKPVEILTTNWDDKILDQSDTKSTYEMSSKELIAYIVEREGTQALVNYLEKGWISNEPQFLTSKL